MNAGDKASVPPYLRRLTGKRVSDSIQEQILSIQVHKNKYYDNHFVPIPATFLKTIKNRKYILEEPYLTYHTSKNEPTLLG